MNEFLLKVFYKTRLDRFWHILCSNLVRLHWKPFQIMTAEQTAEYIVKHQCSVARFGDGELMIAAYNTGIGFQRSDVRLQEALIKVIHSSNESLLLCLPNRVNYITRKQRKTLSMYWQKALREHLYPWTKEFSKERIYGDTNLSRLTEGATMNDKYALIDKIKSIWGGREIILIEGEKTRFGVGNNLLDNAVSVYRILGPAESAFDVRDVLLDVTADLASGLNHPIILLALGPTATVLASDLADWGFQAVDIGHLDISFEHLRSGKSTAVSGKYTNEIEGGSFVEECTDQEYCKQIYKVIY